MSPAWAAARCCSPVLMWRHMRNLDFSSWRAMLVTLLGLAVITLLGVGIRLLVMQCVQQRRERENRQINERLRTLIAAYRTLGGSFTGDLAVDPAHLPRPHSNSARPRGEAPQVSLLGAVVESPAQPAFLFLHWRFP